MIKISADGKTAYRVTKHGWVKLPPEEALQVFADKAEHERKLKEAYEKSESLANDIHTDIVFEPKDDADKSDRL